MATESTPFPTASNPSPGGTGIGSSAGASGLAEGMSTAADDGTFRAPQNAPQSGDLMRRVVQGAHATIDKLADTAAPAVSRLQERVTGANDKMHASADHLREMGDEWAESLRTTVRENPLASVLVALAAGMLIAKLGSSSRD